MRVAIPLLAGVSPSHILLPFDMLSALDERVVVELVGLNDAPDRRGPVVVQPHQTIGSAQPYDVVIVPTLGFDALAGLAANAGFVPWLERQHRGDALMTSWCTGSFLLAEAGVLDGQAATTHWLAARAFEARFPRVQLQPERMLVDTDTVVTCGGSTAVYALLLFLVDRFQGPARTLAAARDCLVDLHRPSQRAYEDGRALLQHDDAQVFDVQGFIRDNIGADLSLDVLSRRAGMSARSLSRRFKAATGLAPTAFVQRARVDAARTALSTSDHSFDAITTTVGYTDPRAFRRLFKRIAGVSPAAYRRLFTAG